MGALRGVDPAQKAVVMCRRTRTSPFAGASRGKTALVANVFLGQTWRPKVKP